MIVRRTPRIASIMRFRETFGLLGEAGCHVRFPSNRIVAICIATSSPALQICFADLGFLDLRIGCPATKEIRDVGNNTACVLFLHVKRVSHCMPPPVGSSYSSWACTMLCESHFCSQVLVHTT